MASDGTTLQEKTLTLAVGMELLGILRNDGYHVVLSRIGDGPVGRLLPGSLSNGLYTAEGVRADLQARADCANAAHAQLLLSIHFDAFGDPTVGGVQTVYDPNRPFSNQSAHFAELLQQSVLHAFLAHGWTVPDRGIVPDTQLAAPTLTQRGAAYGHLLELGPADPGWLDRPSKMPGALSESLFISDPTEADIVHGRTGRHVLSQSLARAIDEYFHVSQIGHVS
jgi:N-acetylmuramoyl-L-alanine amidase